MVAYMRSDVENGLYVAAYKVPTLLTYIVTIFNDAWRLSAVSESEDKKKCEEFYTQIYKYYISAMFVGGGILSVGAQIFAKILFDESFYVAWIFIPILSAATIFTSLDTFLGSVYFTVKRTSMSFWTALAGAVVNIALNFILIPDWGAIGASFATFVGYFLVYVIRAVTMKRFMSFNMYHGKLIVNTVLIGAIATFMTYYGYSNRVYALAVSIVALCISVLFNGRDVFLACRQVFGGIKK
jgi:O-antigen/teichoic acid export membrane protein